MASHKHKPQWWQLYVGLPLLAGMYIPEMRLAFTRTEHTIAQLGILALIYFFLHWWMSENERGLMGMDEPNNRAEGSWLIKVYEIPADESRAHLSLRLPEAGVKGVLSTTFEMDELEPDSVFPAGSHVAYSEHIAIRDRQADPERDSMLEGVHLSLPIDKE